MNQVKLFFTICNEVILDLVCSNTPESREAFIEKIRAHHKNLIKDLQTKLQDEQLRQSSRNHISIELKRLQARQYFIDKHEDMFIKNGYTNMSYLSTYNLITRPA